MNKKKKENFKDTFLKNSVETENIFYIYCQVRQKKLSRNK